MVFEEFWAEFHRHAERASRKGLPVIFRGEPEDNLQLIPSIARNTKAGTFDDINALEDRLLTEFKLQAIPILQSLPSSDIEWLFLAQHYGLPTRLLDWTSNPMIALFFAVEKEDDKNAAIHIVDHQISDQYELFDFKTADILEQKKVGINGILALQSNQRKVIFIRPKYTDSRYLNQRSVFSCPANPFNPLNLSEQQKIIIKAEWKPKLRQILHTFGIVHSFIFPGLEGVTQEIKTNYFDPIKHGRETILRVRAEIEMPNFS
jgi:hypothetical protein